MTAFREGRKRDAFARLLADSIATQATVRASFGRVCLVEVEVTNPYPHDERFVVDVADPTSGIARQAATSRRGAESTALELRLVTDPAEYRFLWSKLPCIRAVPRGTAGGGVEDGIVCPPVTGGSTGGGWDGGVATAAIRSSGVGVPGGGYGKRGLPGATVAGRGDVAFTPDGQVLLSPGETVVLPFVFLSYRDGAVSGGSAVYDSGAGEAGAADDDGVYSSDEEDDEEARSSASRIRAYGMYAGQQMEVYQPKSATSRALRTMEAEGKRGSRAFAKGQHRGIRRRTIDVRVMSVTHGRCVS